MAMTRWIVCLLMAAWAASATGLASAQGLGDVARAEQERRKAVSKAGKVYTNESLKPEPLPSPPPASLVAGSLGTLAQGAAPSTTGASGAAGAASPSSAVSGPGGAASGGTASDVPATESGWRTRAAELRGNVVRQKVLADALQSRINAALLDFVNRDDPAQRAVIESDRNRALAELDRVKLDLKAGEKAVADFEEQARRLSVPPGWLR
jgi:hypothetical protein